MSLCKLGRIKLLNKLRALQFQFVNLVGFRSGFLGFVVCPEWCENYPKLILKLCGLIHCIAYSNAGAEPAAAAAIAAAVVDGVLLILSLSGVMVIYDVALYCMSAHVIIFSVLLGCCIYEVMKRKKLFIAALSYAFLFAACLVDTANDWLNLYPSGACCKIVFPAVFVIELVIMIKVIPEIFLAAGRAEKLEAELADSRISILLSQIQPHFLYNSLNSIYYLCDKDSDAAKRVEDGIEETLTYMNFPSQYWLKIRTNNVIERMNREIRRRTRVVGAFPDGNVKYYSQISLPEFFNAILMTPTPL